MMADTLTRFEHAGRAWTAKLCVTEDRKRNYVEIKPAAKGPPWPTREQVRAAREVYRTLLAKDSATRAWSTRVTIKIPIEQGDDDAA